MIVNTQYYLCAHSYTRAALVLYLRPNLRLSTELQPLQWQHQGAGGVWDSLKSILNFRLCSRPWLSHNFSLLPIYPIHLCCNAITLILPGDLPKRELSQPPARAGETHSHCDCSTPSTETSSPGATACSHPWVYTGPNSDSINFSWPRWFPTLFGLYIFAIWQERMPWSPIFLV